MTESSGITELLGLKLEETCSIYIHMVPNVTIHLKESINLSDTNIEIIVGSVNYFKSKDQSFNLFFLFSLNFQRKNTPWKTRVYRDEMYKNKLSRYDAR